MHLRRHETGQKRELRHELEVDETARHQLHVEGTARGTLGVHERAHLPDIGSDLLALAGRGENRVDHPFRLAPQRSVSRHGAHARQRQMLPCLRLARLVLAEGSQGGRQRPGIAGGTQAEIERIEDAFGGRRVHRGDQLLHDANVVLRGWQRLLAVRHRGRLVIDQEDEVEVGGSGQLARAEPTHRQHRDAAFYPPVPRLEPLRDGAKHSGQHHLGERGVGAARSLRRDGARQQSHPDDEPLLRGEDASAVQQSLKIDRQTERRVELPLQRLAVGKPLGTRFDERVEDVRSALHDGGHARRGGQHHKELVEQSRLGLEQREELDTARQSGQKGIERDERRIRTPRAGDRGEKVRHECRQALSRLRRLHRAGAAEMPAAQDGSHVGRPLEAEAGERLQGLRVVLATCEGEVAGLARKRLLMLEQARIVPLGAHEMMKRLGFQRSRIGEAGHAGDMLQPLLVLRQRMGLRVPHHLDAVLEIAQEQVALRKLGRRLSLDPPLLGERVEHRQRLATPKRRRPPTGDQLLRLYEELDLANAAAPQLHVVAGHGQVRNVVVRLDLAFDRVDVGDGRVVEVTPPDEGYQRLHHGSAQRGVTGTGARLDPSRALPVLAARLVVDQRHRHRHGEWHGGRVGPQPQIGAEDVAVGRAFLHDPHERARHAHGRVQRLGPLRKSRIVRIEEDDDVDVAGIVQLTRAVLAHGDDGEATLPFAEPASRGERRAGLGERDLHGPVGEQRKAARHIHGRPDLQEIGHAADERDPLLGMTQNAHRLGLVRSDRNAFEHGVEGRFEPVAQRRRQRLGALASDVEEIGRQVQDRPEGFTVSLQHRAIVGRGMVE